MKATLWLILLGLLLGNSLLLAVWSNDPSSNTPVCVLPGSQALPKVATSQSGDTYIGWFSNETGNYDVKLQRFDRLGEIYWQDNGALISDNTSMTWLTDWDMKVDLENHAILVFQDIRDEGFNNIFAYRISPAGAFVWGEDGLQLSDSPAFDVSPKVAITSENNVVVAWQSDDVVIMQKISPDGTLLWGETGITLSCANTYSWPQLIGVEDDNIILKLFEDSGPIWSPTRHILAQKFDGEGNAVWEDFTIITDAGGISAWTQIMALAHDNSNGFYIAWHDDRDMDMISSAFVQHVNSEGQNMFLEDGVEVATQGGRQRFYPGLAYLTSTDEIFVFWNEMDAAQNQRGIYGQKFDNTGNRLWGNNGKTIIEISTTDVLPIGVRASQNEIIVVYEQAHQSLFSLINAVLLDSEGEFIWAQQTVIMSSFLSEKLHPEVNRYHNWQWIAVWEDRRSDDGDIYAQNILLNGELGPGMEPPLNVQIDPATAELTWEAPNEDVVMYYVYLDENLVEITSELSYIFEGLENGQDYTAGVSAFYNEGESIVITVEFTYNGTDVDEQQLMMPVTRIRNYPNPFNPQTCIAFNLRQSGRVVLDIHNVRGELIMRIFEDNLEAGDHSFIWNGTDQKGQELPSGIYFYRLEANKYIHNAKMLLLK
ncbi:MAG: hypothetical protein JXB60_02030 [Candidatus Cloacimonetes bacterium]|nr:hypothetical protein [Candidatus Cloacimonadota bacterium]